MTQVVREAECNIVAKWPVRNILVSSLECEGLATPRVKVRSKTKLGKEFSIARNIDIKLINSNSFIRPPITVLIFNVRVGQMSCVLE